VSDDFEFQNGPIRAPRFCLAVEPGVVDFPARCILPPGHINPRHEGAVVRVGFSDTTLFPPTKWDDDE
jgi:hypothetical protein